MRKALVACIAALGLAAWAAGCSTEDKAAFNQAGADVSAAAEGAPDKSGAALDETKEEADKTVEEATQPK